MEHNANSDNVRNHQREKLNSKKEESAKSQNENTNKENTNSDKEQGDNISSELEGLKSGIGKSLASFLGHYPEAMNKAAKYLSDVGHTWSGNQLESVAEKCREAIARPSSITKSASGGKASSFFQDKPLATVCGAMIAGGALGAMLSQRFED